MPLKNYGVLVRRAIDRRLATTSNPHYQVHLIDNDLDYRIAINVRSKTAPSEVAFLGRSCSSAEAVARPGERRAREAQGLVEEERQRGGERDGAGWRSYSMIACRTICRKSAPV